VVASDRILSVLQNTKILKTHQRFILVNTAPASHPGIHWVVLFKPCDGEKIIIFNSYGENVSTYTNQIETCLLYLSKLTNFNSQVESLTYTLQSDKSRLCGVYCTYFVFCMCRRRTLDMFFNQFSVTNRTFNDEYVLHWYGRYINNFRYGLTRICDAVNQSCQRRILN
jgi:hypothetical protein